MGTNRKLRRGDLLRDALPSSGSASLSRSCGDPTGDGGGPAEFGSADASETERRACSEA